MKEVIEKLSRAEKLILHKFEKIKNSLIQRDIFEQVEKTNFPIVGIIGLRGIGKSTYLLGKRIQQPKSIYISCDWTFLKGVDFVDLVIYLYRNFDIQTLFLDEIQFLENWDGVLKNLYDLTNLKVIFSGSSKLNIQAKSYDLSRRVVLKQVPIFSFYEFVQFHFGKKITFTLDELLTNHQKIAYQILDFIDRQNLREEYLRYGEFGYYYQGFKDDFLFLLENSLKKSIYEDIPQIINIEAKNLKKIEKLLFFLANMGPSQIGIGNLAQKIEVDTKTVKNYLDILEVLGRVIKISKYGSLTDAIRKEEKIYLASNNLMFLLAQKEDNLFVGKIRETFFLQNILRILGLKDWIAYKTRTDFIVFYKGKEIEFEIGGKSKKRTDNVWIVKDDILIGEGRQIPLWLFGFLKN